jgi:hypothetical protein
MKRLNRRRAAIAALAATGALLVPAGAFGKIEPVDTSCTNNGGGTPTGQQPSCNTSSSLTQDSENQNPAGAAPAGHNK